VLEISGLLSLREGLGRGIEDEKRAGFDGQGAFGGKGYPCEIAPAGPRVVAMLVKYEIPKTHHHRNLFMKFHTLGRVAVVPEHQIRARLGGPDESVTGGFDRNVNIFLADMHRDDDPIDLWFHFSDTLGQRAHIGIGDIGFGHMVSQTTVVENTSYRKKREMLPISLEDDGPQRVFALRVGTHRLNAHALHMKQGLFEAALSEVPNMVVGSGYDIEMAARQNVGSRRGAREDEAIVFGNGFPAEIA